MLKNSRSRNNSKNKSEQSKEETKPVEKQQIKYPNPTPMSSMYIFGFRCTVYTAHLLLLNLDKQICIYECNYLVNKVPSFTVSTL